MHLLSAHAAISLATAFVAFVVLLLVGLNVLIAIVAALVVGPIVGYGLLVGPADRLEHWMTTMR